MAAADLVRGAAGPARLPRLRRPLGAARQRRERVPPAREQPRRRARLPPPLRPAALRARARDRRVPAPLPRRALRVVVVRWAERRRAARAHVPHRHRDGRARRAARPARARRGRRARRRRHRGRLPDALHGRWRAHGRDALRPARHRVAAPRVPRRRRTLAAALRGARRGAGPRRADACRGTRARGLPRGPDRVRAAVARAATSGPARGDRARRRGTRRRAMDDPQCGRVRALRAGRKQHRHRHRRCELPARVLGRPDRPLAIDVRRGGSLDRARRLLRGLRHHRRRLRRGRGVREAPGRRHRLRGITWSAPRLWRQRACCARSGCSASTSRSTWRASRGATARGNGSARSCGGSSSRWPSAAC